MDENFDKTFFTIMIILIGSVTIFIVSIISSVFIESIFGFSCSNKYEDSRHEFFGGCLVNVGGRYIPEEIYKLKITNNFTNNSTINIK